MMNKTIQELLKNRPVILDGAWGTQMQAKGLPDGACPDEWNLSSPEKVEEVASEYVDPPHRLDRCERHARPGVAGAMKREGADALLVGPIGDIPPVEFEQMYYERSEVPATGIGLT